MNNPARPLIEVATLTHMSPLFQRLFLYRFALLQLGPHCRVEPTRWGVPGLESCLKGEGKPWAWHLSPCQPFSEWSLQPLISPHLSLLLKIRQRQPRRPLILCQWVFERSPRVEALRKLAYPRFQWQQALAHKDAYEPLHWISDFREQPADSPLFELPEVPPKGETCKSPQMASPYNADTHIRFRLSGYRSHPLNGKVDEIRRLNPQSRVWLREDGEPMIQQGLFQGQDHRGWSKREAEGLRQRSERIAQLDARYRGHWFVWSRETDLLEWFGCDLVRSLGGKRRIWRFPDCPDPRDPMGHVILARDRELSAELVPPAKLYLELDQGNRFRDYRQTAHGDPDWWSPQPSQPGASLQGNGWTCLFQQRPEGWYSWDGRLTEAPNAHAFSQWLALFGKKNRTPY